MEIIFLTIFLILFTSYAIAGMSFAPWVPTKSYDLERIFKLANLQPGEVFYDLGCGNGKTVLYAARNFGVKAVGVEMALPLYLVCQVRKFFDKLRLFLKSFGSRNFFRAELASLKQLSSKIPPPKTFENGINIDYRVKFLWKDLFGVNVSEADVVYVFALPRTLREKFRKKMESELKPGARVISYAFHVDGWEPTKTDKPNKKDISVYLYVMKDKT